MRLAALLVIALASPSFALTIAYDVQTPHPENHTYEMTVSIGDVAGGSIDVAMPAWTPGYYKIQNHAKNVRDFTAKSPAGDLAWDFVDKQTWRIQTGGTTSITLHYRVFAHQLSATGADLTDEHAYFHASWICMYVVGALRTPSTITVHPLPGWKIATGLDRAPGDNSFAAPDYDILVDSPFLMGDLDIREFQAGGALHQVAISGITACDRAAMTKDIENIVHAEITAMGGTPPYKRYVFLLQFPRWGSGGLEHLNSTSIVANGEELGDRNRYLKFLFVVAHEFYHLWNVKRIRPAQLGPFDYTKEVQTHNLWAHEGMTNYYAWVSMQRGGVLNRQEYLNFVQEELNGLWRRDGRRRTSPAASSWRTWYDADDGDDVEVSYYASGHILGFALDLEIRRRTAGAKNLNDVMRLAVEKTKGAGYAGDDFCAIVNEATGSDFHEFFRKYVDGTEDLPLAELAPLAGVSYEAHVDAVESDPGFDAWGIGEDLVKITRVPEEGPAVDAGLDEGDILLSAEGKRLRAGTFWNFIHSKKPGEKITFQLFRFERMIEKTVTLREKKKISHLLKLVEKPTEEQKKFQDGWLK